MTFSFLQMIWSSFSSTFAIWVFGCASSALELLGVQTFWVRLDPITFSRRHSNWAFSALSAVVCDALLLADSSVIRILVQALRVKRRAPVKSSFDTGFMIIVL